MPPFHDARRDQTVTVGWRAKAAREMDLRSRWSALRDVGSSRLASLAVVAPLAGYLILYDLEPPIVPQTWRLHAFYLGSVLFSAGTILHIVFCPGQIRTHRTAVAYAGEECAFFSAQPWLMTRMVRRLLDQRSWPSHEFVDEPGIRHRIEAVETAATVGVAREDRDDRMRRPMDEHWHLLDPSRPAVRLAILLLFVAGGLMMVLPALATAATVVARIAALGGVL